MSHVPAQEYYASLPRHIAGAGAIFHDVNGKVLLVKPSYRDTWEIPGGGLEHGEYPFQAVAREVKEETGLELRPGRLLAVDWVPPQDEAEAALDAARTGTTKPVPVPAPAGLLGALPGAESLVQNS